jgi:hypothetical protein
MNQSRFCDEVAKFLVRLLLSQRPRGGWVQVVALLYRLEQNDRSFVAGSQIPMAAIGVRDSIRRGSMIYGHLISRHRFQDPNSCLFVL